MELKKIQLILLIVAVVVLFLGVKTLLPNSGASKPCLWGYKAACSFTPVSTFILFGIGILAFYFRSQMMKAGGLKWVNWLMLIGFVICLAGIVLYSIQYGVRKAGDQKPKTNSVSSIEIPELKKISIKRSKSDHETLG